LIELRLNVEEMEERMNVHVVDTSSSSNVLRLRFNVQEMEERMNVHVVTQVAHPMY
jgi:hypothetical protein